MNKTCCKISARENSRTRTRTAFGALRWLAPAVLLALVPKCPACVAAYIALATGIGISFTAAAYLHGALIAVCVASLAYFVITRTYRLVQRGI